MKNLSLLNKLVFLLNNIFALLFLASFAIPYVAPETLPILSVLSLMVPMFIFVHVIFALYWILAGMKKQMLLSLFCLFTSIAFSYFPYKFNERIVVSGNSFGVMSYNVRLFNKYNWIDKKDIPQSIENVVAEQDPDVLSLQEYDSHPNIKSMYPFHHEVLKGKKNKYGLAIFSKFPIVGSGSLEFKNSTNNAIYADVVRNKDTIRVYNIHLESLWIKPDSVELSGLDEDKSKKLFKRLSSAFTKQQGQVIKFLDHKSNSPGRLIVCGDFNNTSYSWAYKNLKDDLKDSYLEAGHGFGKTYSFNRYPLRIDFILIDPSFNVNEHKNFDLGLSDHEPILARISL